MNVSFLSSTGTFSGVFYNLKKADIGAGEVLYTRNMDGLQHLDNISKQDYVDYLQAWSQRNPRVKKAQLHVAISCKGREKSSGELLEIGKKWLEGMGYTDTPALFVFHKDTDNNHIHIVSSRVDERGKKINDSNEVWRGRSLLREIYGVDLKNQARQDFYSLEDYRISSKHQYAMLWKQLGYRTAIKDDSLKVYREGIQVISFPLEKGEEKVVEGLLEGSRVAEIRNLIAGYSEGMRKEDLFKVLSDVHRIDIAFLGKKESPYGYVVIDHNRKSVYKGGDILALRELLSENIVFSDKEQLGRVNAYAKNRLDRDTMTSRELQDIVKKWGLYVDKEGQVFYKKSLLGRVEEDLIDKMRYNDRLESLRGLEVSDVRALKAVARFYHVDPYDIIVSDSTVGSQRDLLSMWQEAKQLGCEEDLLREQNIVVIRLEGHRYLLDLDNNHVEEMPLEENISLNSSSEIPTLLSECEVEELVGLNVYDYTESSSSVDNSLRKRRR